jgi:hypothetical protein
MGMYATVCGRELKLNGLPASVMIALGDEIDGVHLEEYEGKMYLSGGIVVLREDDVRRVVIEMRNRMLKPDWVSSYNFVSSQMDEGEPLVNWQDIASFHKDVAFFNALATWLCHKHARDSSEIVFA